MFHLAITIFDIFGFVFMPFLISTLSCIYSNNALPYLEAANYAVSIAAYTKVKRALIKFV